MSLAPGNKPCARATVSEVASHGHRATFYSGYDEIAVRNFAYLGSISVRVMIVSQGRLAVSFDDVGDGVFRDTEISSNPAV